MSRFVLDDTSICFCNCHLAAGQGKRRHRNRDLVDILDVKAALPLCQAATLPAYARGGDATTIVHHDICFLGGDLNYRIDLPRETVLDAIAKHDIALLLEQDQLLKETKTNRAFKLRAFGEAPITFLPTYKYDPGTASYDSSDKKRIPAWCDRILWRTEAADKVVPLDYRRHEALISDHRPISAAFRVHARKLDSVARSNKVCELEEEWEVVQRTLVDRHREFWRARL